MSDSEADPDADAETDCACNCPCCADDAALGDGPTVVVLNCGC